MLLKMEVLGGSWVGGRLARALEQGLRVKGLGFEIWRVWGSGCLQ